MVSIIQVIGCKARLRNDLYCVEWGVELYSNQPIPFSCLACHEVVPLTDYSIIQGVSGSAATSPSGVIADLRTKRVFPLYDYADTSELVSLHFLWAAGQYIMWFFILLTRFTARFLTGDCKTELANEN